MVWEVYFYYFLAIHFFHARRLTDEAVRAVISAGRT